MTMPSITFSSSELINKYQIVPDSPQVRCDKIISLGFSQSVLCKSITLYHPQSPIDDKEIKAVINCWVELNRKTLAHTRAEIKRTLYAADLSDNEKIKNSCYLKFFQTEKEKDVAQENWDQFAQQGYRIEYESE